MMNSSTLSTPLEANPAETVAAPVLMVLTHEVDAVDTAGRGPTMRAIIDAAESCLPARPFPLRSLIEQRSYFRLAGRLFSRCVAGRPWPLQCVLFDNRGAIQALLSAIREFAPGVVYFDSVRCYSAIRTVRARFPELRLVCDFDDLMSRRFRLVRDLKQSVNFGYIRRYLPDWLLRMLGRPAVSALVLQYEASALGRVEAEILSTVQCVTLVSPADAAVLRACRTAPGQGAIIVAPPPFATRKPVRRPDKPYRFVFIGSNTKLQNRLTIDWLLALWRTKRIRYPLHIYGQQSGRPEPAPNVFCEGFAADLKDVYASNSLLLAPAFLGGGLKTKLCEALSYGVIPLGNQIAFEAISLPENRLAMSVDQLASVVERVEDHIELLAAEAARLQAYLADVHSLPRFQALWKTVLTGEAAESVSLS